MGPPIPDGAVLPSSDGRAPVLPGAVRQFAVLDALMGGVYSSGIPVSELDSWGDTGIGCCEGLGGEVILIDGEAFECTVDAEPRRMRHDETLPFVEVCPMGDVPGEPMAGLGLDGLTAAVEQRLASRNLFHAVRIDGVLTRVRTRVTAKQHGPGRPLAEVAAEQIETETRSCSGTLIGFWMPRIYQGISVAGLHLHFLSDDRRVGGHVLDLDIGAAVLRVCGYSQFSLRLPLDEHFLSTELTHGEDHRIVAVEGGAERSS
ncbi:acetolactate decarboxylase [Microbacterium enclense]|uniref:Alpha-acetolactate decarboxylase n=1 Tax=Microbacterium enclense TaxID=993073 RepID=A0A443JM45_9MICO|nr:acetolactate decarboxylase [Microbacterium enclense]RWR21576.1 acetolactate decarboxylase [Microbacterium enclense]